MPITTYKDSEFKHGLELKESCILNKYLFDVVYTLMENQNLLKLLTIPNNQPLKANDIEITKQNPIINEYIYPYPKDINTTTVKGSRIYVNWIDGREQGGIFQDATLQIDILVSNDKDVLLINKGRRDLEIKYEIQKTLTGSHGLGLGDLNKLSWNIIMTNDMVGYSLRYFIKDFR
ncbi:hypothetical protein IRP62_11940 (plasmid) [Clostridium botulinum]|uniref:hypothetical protein n=1 Tax=Clostridium botulinum C phage TaxID=12336 RepID=UPI00005DB566|nr:hypothetical protein [Clostridium botulinum]YP_398589.1 hypothetical protein CST159 [Clostridium phage c-st]QPW54308.1 hypothetical protein IRP62_11940 [Clostridium botulinum]BAE47857.1 hypothetical protein CST159 [Clostridium phage c-st]